MKKRALFATGLSLCLLLTACGGQPTKNPADATSSSQVKASSISYAYFGGSAEDWAKAIGKALESSGTYNAFENYPIISEDESKTFGDIRIRDYEVFDGMNVLLYENSRDSLLYQYFITIDWEKSISAPDRAYLAGVYTCLIIKAAEQNDKSAQKIIEELNLDGSLNVLEDCQYNASSDVALYSYVTQDGISMLSILAR